MIVKQRRFGRTGLTVPAITLGAGWVGGLLIRGDRDTRFRQLDDAMAAGVDWVDTAALYGKGQSERMIGEWLAERGARPKPRLTTKFSVDHGQGHFDGQIRRSVEASFNRLGVDRVEALFLHNMIVEGGALASTAGVTVKDVLGPGGVADTMEALRDEGFADHLGFTGLGDPAALKALAQSGRFDLAQIYYNMLNPTAATPAPKGWNTTDFDGLLHDCAAADMGVMGIRIFAGGHLASTERHGREIPLTQNAADAAEEARAEAAFTVVRSRDGSRAQAALRFGMAEDLLSTIVVGVGEDWHFAHALEGYGKGPLAIEALRRLETVRRTDPAFVG